MSRMKIDFQDCPYYLLKDQEYTDISHEAATLYERFPA